MNGSINHQIFNIELNVPVPDKQNAALNIYNSAECVKKFVHVVL